MSADRLNEGGQFWTPILPATGSKLHADSHSADSPRFGISNARRTQSGNVFFTLFGAVGLVGVLGGSAMTVIKGPVTSMHNVTQRTIAENAMIAAARLALVSAAQQPSSGDCDLDGFLEPVPWSTMGTGVAPVGGGFLPPELGAALEDPWGTTYGYCVWDHGAQINHAGCGGAGQRRRAGANTEEGATIVIMSAGADRSFQTQCQNAPNYVVRSPGSDDLVLTYTYGESRALGGGLWNLQSGDPGTAEIAKNVQIKSSGGDVVFGVDSSTDPVRPSIKVDYIQRLNRPSVEFLSNIALGSNWLSGDGGDEGIQVGASGEVGIGGSSAGLFLRPRDGSGSEWALYNPTGDDLRFWRTANGDAMTILNNGNVGIGTMSPTDRLAVASSRIGLHAAPTGSTGINFYTQLDGANALGTGATRGWQLFAATHDYAAEASQRNDFGLSYWNGATWLTRLFVENDTGRIGMGTTSPSRLLDVRGTVYVRPSADTWGDVGWGRAIEMEQAYGILWRHSGTGTARLIGSTNNGNLYIARAAGNANQAVTYDMEINQNGNVGIGLTGPQQQLHVAQNIRSDGQSYYFGPTQRLSGDGGRELSYYANHSTETLLWMRDLEGAIYGGLYGDANGAAFGLLDGDGQWSYLAIKDNQTQLRINNVNEMTIYPTHIDVHGNRIINLANPTAAQDAVPRSYMEANTISEGTADGRYVNVTGDTMTGNLTVNTNIYAPRYYDLNDTNYYLDPNSVSYLNDLRMNIIYDRQDTNYYLDPNNTSRLNHLHAQIIYDVNDTNYYIDPHHISRMNRIDFSHGYDINDGNYYIDLNQTTRMNHVHTHIMYDAGDTNYYIDPNNWSRVNSVQVMGQIHGQWPTSGGQLATKDYVDSRAGGAPSCVTRTHSGWAGHNSPLYAYCNGGEILTGGGCQSSTTYDEVNRPDGDGWMCMHLGGGTVTIYLRCCTF